MRFVFLFSFYKYDRLLSLARVQVQISCDWSELCFHSDVQGFDCHDE